MDSNDFVFFKKIMVFGSEGSGKSSLISIFENKKYEENESFSNGSE